MADIMDYMEWRGDVTFDMIPVNEVDGLIFAICIHSVRGCY